MNEIDCNAVETSNKAKTKVCKKCGVEKILEDNFYKHSKYKDGHSSVCKNCLLEDGKSRRKQNKESYDGSNIPKTKVCYTCKEEKISEEFKRCYHTLDGLNSNCRTCSNRYSKNKREEKKVNGICAVCNKKAESGRVHCRECADRQIRATSEVYRLMVENGICVSCKEPMDRDGCWCSKCLDKASKKSKKQRDEWKSLGKCNSCGRDREDSKVNKCRKCRIRSNETQQRIKKELKKKVIDGYGGKCQCEGGCPESNISFLTIDHINNDGNEKRKAGSHRNGADFFRWIIKNNFPKDLRCLCWNCNCGRQFNSNGTGLCPHIIAKENVEWSYVI